MHLPVEKVPKDFAFEQTLTLTPINLINGWLSDAPPKVNAFLASNQDALFFGFKAYSSAIFNPEHKLGEFIEGLWEYDVAELFFTDGSKYQEFNFSPSGAYWSATFSSYRERETVEAINNIEIQSEIESNYWQVVAKIPFFNNDHLLFNLEKSEGNITAIVGKPNNYFSHMPISCENPDFHSIFR